MKSKAQWATFWGVSRQLFGQHEVRVAELIDSYRRGVVPVPSHPDKEVPRVEESAPSAEPAAAKVHGYDIQELKSMLLTRCTRLVFDDTRIITGSLNGTVVVLDIQ